MFKNKLGRPRAIHYLTPPPLAFFGGDVHVQKRSDVLDPRHGTIDPRRGTLDLRPPTKR